MFALRLETTAGTARLLAVTAAVVSVLLCAAAVGLAAASEVHPVMDVLRPALVLGVPFPLVGALIVLRYPRNAMGGVMIAAGLLQAINIAAGQYGRRALVEHPGTLAAGDLALWLEQWTWVPSLGLLLTLLLQLFPDGRLPSPRWRWLLRPTVFGLLVTSLGFAIATWPQRGLPTLCVQREHEPARELLAGMCRGVAPAEDGPFVAIGAAALALVAVCAVGSVVSLVVRYRRSAGVQRQQLRWFLTGAILAFSSIAAMFSPLDDYRGLLALGILAIPAAIAVAVLRYRLYDLDLLINRTAVYVVVTAAVAAIYVLVVGRLGSAVLGAGPEASSLVAAGVIAAVFAPVRDIVQRAVNRLMYGDRDDPYSAIRGLARRLGSALRPDEVLPAVVEAVRHALRIPYAAIAVPEGDTSTIAAASGTPVPEPVAVPLTYQGETVGTLLLASRGGADRFAGADERLVEELARHAGVAVHGAMAMHELRRSRERLVLAREEERRRLRRDLHDELGPTLAALGMAADRAGDLIRDDPDAARSTVEDLRDGLREAVGDVRRLAHDLRPPALDELGLVDAVRERAARFAPALSIEVLAADDDLPADLPAAVEVAAYRIVQEALMNAVRHSGAASCSVRLGVGDGVLEIEVADDGAGIQETHEPGIGLRSMRERAAELGGSCTVRGREPVGTVVAASLPLERATFPQEA